MRLRDPEGLNRRRAPRRAGRVSRRPCAERAAIRGSRRRAERLGPDQALDRGGGPARDMAQAGALVHRRCRACDVADRWRRHQSRGAGRRGGRESPVGAVTSRPRERRRSRARAAAARISDARHAGDPGVSAEPRHQPRAGGERLVAGAARDRLLARFPMLRRIPARLLGLGVRPEHVRTPVA
jgi:hypothetical protein